MNVNYISQPDQGTPSPSSSLGPGRRWCGSRRQFDDGGTGEYDAIIWATGYRVDHSWIEISGIKEEHGQVRDVRGVTESSGLYLLGMTWQYRRTSALLGWVGEDAAFLADKIEEMSQRSAAPRQPLEEKPTK